MSSVKHEIALKILLSALLMLSFSCSGKKSKSSSASPSIEQESDRNLESATPMNSPAGSTAESDGIQKSAEITPEFTVIKGRRLLVFDDRDEGFPERYELVLSREMSVTKDNFVVEPDSNLVSSPHNAAVKGHRIHGNCTLEDRQAIYGDPGQVKPVVHATGTHLDVAPSGQFFDELEVLEADVNPTLRCSMMVAKKEMDPMDEPGLVVYGYSPPESASENFKEAVKWVNYIFYFPEQPDAYYAVSAATLKALLKEKDLTEDDFTSNYRGAFNFASLFTGLEAGNPKQVKKIFGFNVVDSLPALTISGLDPELQTENSRRNGRETNVILNEDGSASFDIVSNDLELDAITYSTEAAPSCTGYISIQTAVAANKNDYRITFTDQPATTTASACYVIVTATSNLTATYTVKFNVFVMNNLRDWCEYSQNASLGIDAEQQRSTEWLLAQVNWARSGNQFNCSDPISLNAANALTVLSKVDRDVDALIVELNKVPGEKVNPLRSLRQLATLKNLETLELATNDVQLAETSFLTKLTRLKSLTLRGHTFTEVDLSQSSQLKYLDLAGNALVAAPALHATAPLEHVVLSMNRMTNIQSIPSQTNFATKQLKTLNLSGNHLTGFPAFSSNSWPLQILDLGANELTASATLVSYTGIRTLSLAFNQNLTATALSGLASLQDIDVGKTGTTCAQWNLPAFARCSNSTPDFSPTFCSELGGSCP